MKKSRRPFLGVVEEYAFGAAVLKDEINHHKRKDEKRRSLYKAVGIRLLYAYTFVGIFVLIGIGILGQRIDGLRIEKIRVD